MSALTVTTPTEEVVELLRQLHSPNIRKSALSCRPRPKPSARSRPSALSDFLADELAGRRRSSVALRRR